MTHVWSSLDPAEKAELRHFLMEHLLQSHASLPPFIRNKLIKVVVLIGRSDWPHSYPEFLSHILQVKAVVLGECHVAVLPMLATSHFSLFLSVNPKP